MRILATTDLRGATVRIPQILDVVRRENIDALVFAGNIVGEDVRIDAYRTGEISKLTPGLLHELEEADVEAYEAFFDQMSTLDIPVIVIPGFLDAPERLYLQAALNHETIGPNVHMVHRSFFPIPSYNLVAAGFGGAISDEARETRLALVYPAWEAEFALDYLRQLEWDPLLVFHTPPRYGNIDLEKSRHIGHERVTHIIKMYKPRYVIVGSALDGQGVVTIGTSLVVNPGPLFEGHYAILDTNTDDVSFHRLPSVERAEA